MVLLVVDAVMLGNKSETGVHGHFLGYFRVQDGSLCNRPKYGWAEAASYAMLARKRTGVLLNSFDLLPPKLYPNFKLYPFLVIHGNLRDSAHLPPPQWREPVIVRFLPGESWTEYVAF